VAAVLLEHESVRDAAVIGLPDERLGQVPVAAVVLSSPVAEEALQELVRSRLAAYAVPVRVVAVEALPRTPTMKVARAELERMLG